MYKILANVIYIIIWLYIFLFEELSTFSNIMGLVALLIVIYSTYTNIKNLNHN
jgi:hypothetical protein